MKRTILLIALLVLVIAIEASAQISIPRASQRQAVSQTIGDTTVEIVYHRPNVNGREVWGALVPYGEVWRTGANEATTFEVSGDVMINGEKLPKGKYSLHTVPNRDQWTIIFNKKWDQWGSFNYKQADDALRVSVKPEPGAFKETFTFDIDNVAPTTADIVIAWERLRVPFKVDIGDLNGRILSNARRLMAGNPVTAARFVLDSGMKGSYSEAITWLDSSLSVSESFNALFLKARILSELGRNADALSTAERALQVGKSATPPANTGGVEELIKKLQGK